MVLVSILGYKSMGNFFKEKSPSTSTATKQSEVITGRFTAPLYILIYSFNFLVCLSLRINTSIKMYQHKKDCPIIIFQLQQLHHYSSESVLQLLPESYLERQRSIHILPPSGDQELLYYMKLCLHYIHKHIGRQNQFA